MNSLTRLVPGRINPYTVGFDGIFRDIERLAAAGNSNGYPPYNLLQNGEEDYTIEMAIAGFRNEEIDVTAEGRKLTISGNPSETAGEKVTIHHRGIARRPFTREFILAQHVEVAEASLADGILKVNLRYSVPESARPRRIEVAGTSAVHKVQPAALEAA